MTTQTHPRRPVLQPAATSSPTAPPATPTGPLTHPHPGPRGPIGWIVPSALATGLVAVDT
jgi:hypothetical protein